MNAHSRGSIMAEQPSPNANLPVARNPGTVGYGGNFGPVPIMAQGMTFSTMGSYGLRAFGGYVREEFLPQLQGRQGATVYREMSDNSAVIGGMIFAIQSTMRKVQWRVVAAADTPEATEAAEFAEGLMDDMAETWEDFISDGLSMVTYGYAPMELCYKRRLGHDPGPMPLRPGKKLPRSRFDDGRIGWDKIAIRGQDTVFKWFFDEDGDWLGLTQQPYLGPLLDVPREKLLLFRPSQHKNNPEGRSVLRNAYRSYYMVKRLEEQEAILFERLGGIPVIKMPGAVLQAAEDGDADAINTLNGMKQIAMNLRIDEQMGVVFPSDVYENANGAGSQPMYSLELVAPGGGKGGGSAADSSAIINRHNNAMMMSTLADFLMLGHGPNGTEALADSKKGMFFQGVEGYLNSMGAVINNDGLTRLWDLNAMDHETKPMIEPDLAQELDLDVLGNFINRLATSGMAIFPNTALEAALMDAAGLPDINDPSAMVLLDDAADEPTAIVGPYADAKSEELAPTPAPVIAPGGPPGIGGKPPGADIPPGSATEKLWKVMQASVARRVIRKQGNGTNINTRRAPVRRSVIAK